MDIVRERRDAPLVTALGFFFDPICPFAWRASRLVREVQGQQDLAVDWQLFSLAVVNDLDRPELLAPLRVLALARREGGNRAVGGLYQALGEAIHERGAQIGDPEAMDRGIREALHACGLDPDMLEQAMRDPSTLEDVMAEHREAVDRYGAYGVPWLVPKGQDFGFNGPVINRVPAGAEAAELWEHVSWLIQQPYFFEIKRER